MLQIFPRLLKCWNQTNFFLSKTLIFRPGHVSHIWGISNINTKAPGSYNALTWNGYKMALAMHRRHPKFLKKTHNEIPPYLQQVPFGTSGCCFCTHTLLCCHHHGQHPLYWPWRWRHWLLPGFGRERDALARRPLIVNVLATLGGEALAEFQVHVGSVLQVGDCGGGSVRGALRIDAAVLFCKFKVALLQGLLQSKDLHRPYISALILA